MIARKPSHALGWLLAAGACVAAGVMFSESTLPESKNVTETDPTPLPQSACAFVEEERIAFDMRSTVAVAGAPSEADRLEGTLSLEVVEASDSASLLRGAFDEVTLTQRLSQNEDRVNPEALEGAPFFVRMERSCRIAELGFPRSFDSAARQLVQHTLRATEIVLPEDPRPRWEAEQEDGGGSYTARYTAEPVNGELHIVRMKDAYHVNPVADRLGVRVQVLGAHANARVSGDGLVSVEGREQIAIRLASAAPQTIEHRFSMEREDRAFRAVAFLSPADARFGDEPTSTDDHRPEIAPAHETLDRSTAQARFVDLATGQHKDAFAAARFLASWLLAHPEEGPALLAELRNGAIADEAHAALFFAFELAGDDSSRAVLAEALVDEELSSVNRARAAAALADHGEPTHEVATLLRERAEDDSSRIVANVSRLGLGTLASRTDGELRYDMQDMLVTELERATDDEELVTAIDAIGNSGDDHFAGHLSDLLDAPSTSARAHAAEALGRLSPDVARSELIERLATEEDPRVLTSVLMSLSRLDSRAGSRGTLADADLALAALRLSSSAHPEVRAGVVEWLGRWADEGRARQTLALHFPNETELQIRRRIGAFVTAAELRAVEG
ncbi:MAG: HEAT repeat domain-containing protein [Myxococcota bacterium]